MDTSQWAHQGLGFPMEDQKKELLHNSEIRAPILLPQQHEVEVEVVDRKAPRQKKEQALHCPRCNSTNTKFCYYNNYSLTQPRYFCKTCRRYWTEGGSLRNVPVGGGSRKNKRSSSSSSSSSTATATAAATTTTTTLPSVLSSDQNPKFHEGQDLNLAFRLPEFSAHDHFPNMGSNCASAADPLSAMELLRSTGGISNRPGMNIPFMPMASMPTAEYQSGYGAHDYMRSSTLSFPNLDAVGERMQGAQDSEQRLLFPFEDSSRQQQNGGGNPPGFWNGMLGSGGGGGSGSW